jgi:hypothetical protein
MTHRTSVWNNHPHAGQAAFRHGAHRTAGSALVAAAMFCAIASLLLISILTWAANHGRLIRRQQEWLMAQYVAEGATEKVISAIRSNLYATGVAPSQTTLNLYATNQLPSASDSGMFTNYHIISVSGVTNAITVSTSGTSTLQAINSGTYTGLNALVTSYTITARANSYKRPVNLTTGVQRVLNIESIPIFQFAVFYQGVLEIMPGANMTINGGLHSNNTMYLSPNPGVVLTIDGNTTAVGGINNNPPASLIYSGSSYDGTRATPVYDGTVTPDAGSLNLPIASSTGDAILDPPPGSGSDPISSERLYNEAGLVIKVSNSGISAVNGSGSSVTLNPSVITTTNTLYDYREDKTIALTQIDVGNLISHSEVPANGIIWVEDTRTSPQETAIRLTDAATLPAGGLTVATPNPLYVWGNYNTTDVPSSILCDAIDILSGAWRDSNSSQGIGSRVATSTTVNTAIYTGNVPTSGESYSGGLENLPRFLEDWSSATFTYKGAMICMFNSVYATGLWGNASYNPPTRVWSFDTQFLYSSTLPPGTPALETITRTAWATTQ